MAKRYTPIPNDLIDDTRLHHSAKKVYAALALSRRPDGSIQVSLAKLGRISGLCQATVLQGLAELEEAGYIRKKRSWRYSVALGRLVIAANTYRLRSTCPTGYSLIPAAVFGHKLTGAEFAVLLYLYRCAGRTGRAHPSIRFIAGAWRGKTGHGLDMAKSTVQRALKRLAQLQLLVKHFCRAALGCLSCNSYYLTDMILGSLGRAAAPAQTAWAVRDPAPETPQFGGGPIFWVASSINKITKDIYLAEKKKGVGEFGGSYKNPGEWLSAHPLWHNGQGVLVSFCEEQALFS